MNIQDHLTPENVEKYRGNWEAFEALGERYRADSALRDRLDGGDVSDALTELGLVLPPDIEARIVADTSDMMHVVLPPDPNTNLSDEMLSAVAGGGKTAGSAGTVGTAGSVACSTIPSSASSAGTAGSAGTAA
jgi:hypothetical protein